MLAGFSDAAPATGFCGLDTLRLCAYTLAVRIPLETWSSMFTAVGTILVVEGSMGRAR